MGLKKAIEEIHELLAKATIDHALIGGFALAVHGINRATGDIDLLIDEDNRSRLINELNSAGYSLRAETPEVLHFQGPVRLDILLAKRPVSRGMLARANVTPLLNIKCLDPEDLIGLKIQAYRNNPRRELLDKADIQFLLEKYDGQLDMSRVKTYADLFGQWPEVERLRKKP